MTQSYKHCFWQMGLANSLAISGVFAVASGLFPITCFFVNSAFAQSAITPDDTLGSERSYIDETEPFGESYDVLTGGATRGNNLFHSFREFNVREGRSAYFLSPSSSIQNILVRVTGNNRSEINGTLGTYQMTSSGPNISNANLFLINPNGIIFGPNATLTVGGSFVGSTANAIKFADGTSFSATDPQTTPLLTMNVPIGLQMGRNAGEINGQGKIEVGIGKTLALVGGNVSWDGTSLPQNTIALKAPSGQIALGGILEEGTIGLNLDNSDQPLSFPDGLALADVTLSNKTEVNVNGESGGYIQIQGRRVTLTDASQVFARTQGSQDGRGIFIQAEQLTLQDGSQVSASTYGEGKGGNLDVRATDFVQVSGTDENGNASSLLSSTYGQGAAGNLSIETKQLIVENGGNIAASARENSQGFGGNLEVTADVIRLIGSSISGSPSGLFAQTYGSNDAGSLTINTRQLIIQNGAQIVAGTQPNSQGNGGRLTVNASDFVELSGTTPNGQDTSGLFARSQGSGDAGSVYINTGKLIVRDQAQVTVSALGGGNAGNLEITAREILLDTKGQLLAETTSGDGGNIKLQLENLLLLRNNSQILTNARGGGNAGNITITIPDGSIVAVSEENSDISADAEAGNGGSVNIDAFRVFGIQPREKRTELSDITASSESGPQGNIEITTSDVEPRPEVINLLPNQPVEPKVSQVCQAGTARNNSFTIAGRGGLPANPTETLNSDAVLTEWITLDKVGEISSSVTRDKNSTNVNQASIVEATGWVINAKGEVVLTVNAPDALHNSWQKSTDCSLP